MSDSSATHQPIRRVALLGVGAIGGYLASRFLSTDGFATTVVAKAERARRIELDGLIVNGVCHKVPVSRPGRVEAPADLILVALKYNHLDNAIADLHHLVGEDTIIISAMNGLDSEEIIGRVYGMDKMLYAVALGIDAVREGNRITYSNPGKIVFGEADNSQISPRVRRVQEAFETASIPYETPRDMTRTLWHKFMINVGINAPSAILGAPYGVFQSHAEARLVMDLLMREVLDLATVVGVDLGEQDIDGWHTILDAMSPAGKTSMLQDIESGRKTEIEAFQGKAVQLGKTHSVPTPANETLLHMVRILESA